MPARARLLRRRQLPGQDRDEDDVVDAEDDLEERQRREGDPDLRVGQPVHRAPLYVNGAGHQGGNVPGVYTPNRSASHVSPSSLGGAM